MFARASQGSGATGAERRRQQYKKGIVGEDSRRKREDQRNSLRKQARDDVMMQKRRTLNPASAVSGAGAGAGAADSKEMALSLDTLPSHVQAIMGPGDATGAMHTAAVQALRKLLSVDKNPPIGQVIASGVVPRLVEFLAADSLPKLQFEAAWSLTNVASGTSEQTHCVLEHGAVPALVRLVLSPDVDVKEQAVWCLGNIAGDSPQFRNFCLEHGMLEPLLVVLQDPATSQSLSRNAVWALSNLCRGKPAPALASIAPAVPVLAKMIQCTDTVVVTDALWALSYISDGPNDNIDHVLASGAGPSLIRHLSDTSFQIQTPALRAAGNILTGSDAQTQQMIDAGILMPLCTLLSNPRKALRKEAAWALSNITAGNAQQTQRVFDTVGLLPEIVRLLGSGDHDVRRECAWVVSNATTWKVAHQIRALVRVGAVAALCDFLKSADVKIIDLILEACTNILEIGQAAVRDGKSASNEFYDVFEEAEGIERLEDLQDHKSTEIYQKAVGILESYFQAEDEEAGNENSYTNTVAPGGQQFALTPAPLTAAAPSAFNIAQPATSQFAI